MSYEYYSVKSKSTGHCLDVAVDSTLQLYPCNGKTSQQFLYWNDDRLYSALGTLCVEGDSTYVASIFVYSTCVDTWTIHSDGTFTNDGEDMCMTDIDGYAVSLQPCNGGSQQIWSFDQFSSNPTPSPIFPPSNAIPYPVSSSVQAPSPIFSSSKAIPYPVFSPVQAPSPTTPTSDPPIVTILGIVATVVSILGGLLNCFKTMKEMKERDTQDRANKRRNIWIAVFIGFLVGMILLGVGFATS
jgi:hypothetical protein